MNTKPNSSTDNTISWHPWDADAFKLAQTADKPILLMITAQWCYWCHVMLEDSYMDPDVISFVNDRYIPILVDNDRRPEINFRYNVGGWPTTAVLTPHGGMLAGATYLTPDQLLSMLYEISEAYLQDKPGLYDRARELFLQHQQRASRVGLQDVNIEAAPRVLDHGLIESICRMSVGTYDPVYGGFGYEPKFPNAPILSLMSHFYARTGELFFEIIIRKTLDALQASPMHDDQTGGFFRYTKTRDWRNPQYEKLLEDNIVIASAYFNAGLSLNEPKYLETFNKTISFIHDTLYDSSSLSYRGSIGADSDYFRLNSAQRLTETPPSTDPYSYLSATAKYLSVVLQAKLAQIPIEIDHSTFDDILTNLYEKVSSPVTVHAYQGKNAGQPTNLLVDLAAVAESLGLAIQTNTLSKEQWLSPLTSLIETMMLTYYDERRGGFFDIPQGVRQPGYMGIREKPLPENLTAIKALIAYHKALGGAPYADAIRITLLAFLDVYGEYGEHSADYGLVASIYLDLAGLDHLSA